MNVAPCYIFPVKVLLNRDGGAAQALISRIHAMCIFTQ